MHRTKILTPLHWTEILKILLSSESHGFFKVILTHRLLYSLRLKWTRISFYHFYCSIKTLKSTQQHFLNQSFVRNKNINFLYNSYDQSHIIINPNQVQIKQKTKVKVTRGWMLLTCSLEETVAIGQRCIHFGQYVIHKLSTDETLLPKY